MFSLSSRLSTLALIVSLCSLLLAACVTSVEPVEPVEPVTEEELLGTAWEWTTLLEDEIESEILVPDPTAYTVQFLPDGSVQIQADCNQVLGSYIMRRDTLLIELGPSTMAFCGDDSLDQDFLDSLLEVEMGTLVDEDLRLLLADDAGYMDFSPASIAAEATATLSATVEIPTPAPEVPTARVTAERGINIRMGPGTNYPVIGLAPFDTSSEIVGRSSDGQWWVIRVPAAADGQGWVAADFVEATGADNVSVLPAPPLPATTVPSTPAATTTAPATAPATVTPSPNIEFSADPNSLSAGACTTLRWNVENVQAIWVYPQGENYEEFPVEGSGERQECPTASTTYEMRVALNDGSIETYQARVDVEGTPAPVIEFGADPTQLESGECTTLLWQVENVEAVWVYPQGADYEDYPVAGEESREECPASTTTYEMRVELPSGELELRQVTVEVSEGNPLADTSWSVAALFVDQQPLPDTTLTLAFDADDAVSGSGGCNNFSGIYTQEGATLLIGGIASTRSTCGDEIDAQEQLYLDALQSAASYTLEGGQLIIRNASGQEILRFNAVRLSQGIKYTREEW